MPLTLLVTFTLTLTFPTHIAHLISVQLLVDRVPVYNRSD